MFAGPASRCVRSPGNRARPGDSDRKAGRREARTSAMKGEVRAAGQASARLWGRPLCKRWRAHLSVSYDKKSGVPRDVPFLGLGPARVKSLCRGSAECERKSPHARIEKLDLELAISNGLRLSDQLIEPLLGHRAVALVVNVDSVSSARRLSIDEHAKAHGSSSRCRSHDQMKIAGVKAIHDAPVGFVQHRGLSLHRPITGTGPMIERESRGGRIDATLVQY